MPTADQQVAAIYKAAGITPGQFGGGASYSNSTNLPHYTAADSAAALAKAVASFSQPAAQPASAGAVSQVSQQTLPGGSTTNPGVSTYMTHGAPAPAGVTGYMPGGAPIYAAGAAPAVLPGGAPASSTPSTLMPGGAPVAQDASVLPGGQSTASVSPFAAASNLNFSGSAAAPTYSASNAQSALLSSQSAASQNPFAWDASLFGYNS